MTVRGWMEAMREADLTTAVPPVDRGRLVRKAHRRLLARLFRVGVVVIGAGAVLTLAGAAIPAAPAEGRPTSQPPTPPPTTTPPPTDTPTEAPSPSVPEPQLPDLVISLGQWEEQSGTGPFTVTNNGSVAAGAFTVEVSSSGNRYEFPDGLAPGQSAADSWEFESCAEVSAVVDPLGQVEESREDNNGADMSTPCPPSRTTTTSAPLR